MRLLVISVGRMKAGPERELFDRYLARAKALSRSVGVADVELRELDESRARRPEDRREDEAARILAMIGPRDALVALDERGSSPTSEAWATEIGKARDAAESAYVVVIGGPDGLAPSLRAKARRVIAFGAMTWPHQLVRVMLGEQIYRALSILAGHPYHRA